VIIPHCTPASYPDSTPSSRLAAHIQLAFTIECDVALLGLPDDTGVRLNSGRPGAAQGPAAFREALSKYGVASPQGFRWPRIFDAGDVMPASGQSEAALHETHRRITEATSALLDLGLFPIAIGGGHDLTFPFVRAVAARHDSLAGFYLDAHLDVRDTVGSGMPFRSLIQSCNVGPLLIAGFNPLVNAREHVSWFIDHGGEIADDDWADHLDHTDPESKGPALLAPLAGATNLFASFDLDAIDAAFAPGVSALNPAGIDTGSAARAAFIAASDPRLRCLDIMELSPPHDEQGRTARVAAHLFLHALMGLRLGPLMQDDDDREIPAENPDE
jgi:arginase family enzyme